MKLKALGTEEKRRRSAPKRLLSGLAARLPGAPSRFRRVLADAVAAEPSQSLRYALSFALAERVLGEQAIIEADPKSIDRWLFSEARSGERVELPRKYFLIDGPLKPLTRALNRSGLDAEVREFVNCEGNYHRTKTFRMLTKRLKEEGTFLRNGVAFRSGEDVEAYCGHHLRLIESIRRHGVVRRAELARIGASARRMTPNAAFLERVETDAGVAVGADGRLLRYRGGFHRTAAARELGLASMPVQVKLVHLTWLRKLVGETGLAPADALIEGLKRLSVSARRP